MNQIAITISIICMFLSIISAQKYNHEWLVGYGDIREQQFGISELNFHNKIVEVNYYGGSESYALGFRGSFINNRDGEFILHTNHCDVRDSAWNVISGQELITPSGIAVDGCFGPGSRAYSGSHNCIIIPNLENDSIYYIIHKDADIDFDLEEVRSDSMWVSTIKLINGNYDYIGKKKINEIREKMLSGKLSACPNRSRDIWWILMPLINTDTFLTFLVKNDSVIRYPKQQVGLKFLADEFPGIGQAQYSPDGRMFGMNTVLHGLLLYDFDNKTGQLSNFREIPYPNSENGASGLCFSPDSRFIYLTTAEHIYQVDLENNNEIYLVGQYRSRDATGWPVGLGKIFAGPDCRLYISPGTTTYYLHVILEPNKKGAECGFFERAIELPTNIPFHLPNLPQYRYLSGCDSAIAFPFEVNIDEKLVESKEVHIFPNPSSQRITISMGKVGGELRDLTIIINIGQVMESFSIHNSIEVDVSDYPAGLYFVKENSGECTTGKFVVE